MSTLKELLKDVPVEWKDLEFLSNISIGEFVHKDKQSSLAKYPVYNGGITPTGYYDYFNNEGENIIISARGANAGFTNLIFEPYWAGNSSYSINIKKNVVFDIKFLFYFLKSNEDILKETQQKGGIPAVSKKQIQKIQIPIPYPNNPEKSLEIQQEMVRILDVLSEQNKALTSALAQELDQRKKQYAYYREELFRFEGKEVEWKTLGENISKTSNIKWSHYNGNFKYIDLSSVDRYQKIITETTAINAGNAPSRAQKIVLEDDVIFATTRPTQMRVCLITEEFSNQIASTGFCVLRAIKHTVLPKWILYQLTSNSFKNYLEENQAGIAYPAISDAKIKEFKIPIPFPNDKEKSIKEQERIVRLLDQYDEATKNIVAQLEKEIELRNKQYEYYRNLLLSFPKEN